ncbi:MAG: hypothetical protein AB7K24_23370, partial [Gemmataceae bacterium]
HHAVDDCHRFTSFHHSITSHVEIPGCTTFQGRPRHFGQRSGTGERTNLIPGGHFALRLNAKERLAFLETRAAGPE